MASPYSNDGTTLHLQIPSSPKRSASSTPDDSSSSKRIRLTDEEVIVEPVVGYEDSPAADAVDSILIHSDINDLESTALRHSSSSTIPGSDCLVAFSTAISNSTHYIPLNVIRPIITFLHEHVATMRTLDPLSEASIFTYQRDSTSFDDLAFSLIRLLDVTDPFDRQNLGRVARLSLQASLQSLYEDVVQLAIRITTILPVFVDEALRNATDQQSIRVPLLMFVIVASKFSTDDQNFTRDLIEKHGLNLKQVIDTHGLHPKLPRALETLLDYLVDHIDHINGSLDCVQAVLHLMSYAVYTNSKADQPPTALCKQAHHTVSLTHSKILPLLAQKSPKSVPNNLYITLFNSISHMLEMVMDRLSDGDVQRFLKSFLMTIAYRPADEFTSLTATHSILVCQFAWQIEVAKALIHTDFMVARKLGVCWLRRMLHKAALEYGETPAGRDHPVIRAVRDMMKRSAVVPYIFGPQSHAGLMWETKGIVSFIAWAGAWDERMVDCIWSACTDGGEDELLKSAFDALHETCQYLTHDDLLDLLLRFCATDVDKLGPFAAEFLTRVLKSINTTEVQSWRQCEGLAMPYVICMDILHRLDAAPPSVAVSNMRRDATKQLLLPLTSTGSIAQRIAITERCSAHVRDQVPQANVSSDILRCYLQQVHNGQASSDGLILPSLNDAVAEFVHQIQTIHGDQARLSTNAYWPIVNRAELITYLIALPDQATPLIELEEEFWSHAVGPQARHGWKSDIFEHMLTITLAERHNGLVTAFLQRRLETYLPSVPCSHASKNLLKYLEKAIEQSHTGQAKFEKLAEDVLWQQLLRFTLTVHNNENITNLSQKILCRLLIRLTLASDFLMQHLQTVVEAVSDLDSSDSEQYVKRSFDVFHTLIQDEKVLHIVLSSIDRLETLLKSRSAIVAHHACRLLRSLPLPSSTYDTMMDAQSFDTWLAIQPWRIVHTVNVLLKHLQHDSRAKAHDNEFARTTLTTLVDILKAAMHTLPGEALCFIAQDTSVFLQIAAKRNVLVNDISEIASLCAHLLQRAHGVLQGFAYTEPKMPTAQEQQLVSALHRLTLDLCRLESNIWLDCAKSEKFTSLYSCLILEADAAFFPSILHDISVSTAISSDEVRQIYITTFIDILPDALHRPEVVSEVLRVLQELIVSDKSWRSREQVSTLLGRFTLLLWHYEHKETTFNRLPDIVLQGLLSLVLETACIMRSFHDPSQQHISADEIFERLLYPIEPGIDLNSHDDLSSTILTECVKHVDTPRENSQQYTSPRVLHTSTRQLCYKIIMQLCVEPKQNARLLERFGQKMDKSPSNRMDNSWVRPALLPGGLLNLGMTCYMNSLLQQIFSNVRLRSCLLNMTIADSQRQELLIHVQRLFTFLQDSVSLAINTAELAKIMQISAWVQDDVHAFYTIFISALEDNILLDHERLGFSRLYSGKSVTRILGSCGHVSEQLETLNGLSITVQNKSGLEASLNEYFQPEALQGDNQYNCTLCTPESGGEFVSASKCTHLERLPDNLTICLKRCSINAFGLEEKNNDAFSFPEQIDLAFCQQAQNKESIPPAEKDIFTLVGVIVHTGTLSSGHYWSFVRRHGTAHEDTKAWIRLEDRSVSYLGYDDVYSESKGGPGIHSSAYMLLYQRHDALLANATLLEPNVTLTTSDALLMPPRVHVPEPHKQELDDFNRAAYDDIHALDPSFRDFLLHLASASTNGLDTQSRSSSLHEDADVPPSYRISKLEPICRAVGNTLGAYTAHVVLARDDAADLKSVENVLEGMLGIHPSIAFHFLSALSIGKGSTARTYAHKDHTVTHVMDNMKLRYLRLLRSERRELYPSAFFAILDAHHQLLSDNIIDRQRSRWLHFFGFARRLGGLGNDELDRVLERDYVRFALDVTQAEVLDTTSARSADVANANLGELEILWKFLRHVVDQVCCGPSDRQEIRYRSVSAILVSTKLNGLRFLPWLMAAAQQDWSPKELEKLACGDLVRCLVGNRISGTVEAIHDTLIACCSSESCMIEPTCILSSRFIDASGDGYESSRLLTSMFSVLEQEVIIGESVLELLSEAVIAAPWAVSSTLSQWVPMYVSADSSAQEMVAEWVEGLLSPKFPSWDDTATHSHKSPDIVRLQQIDLMVLTLMRVGANASGPSRALAFVIKILELCCAFGGRLRKKLDNTDDSLDDELLQENIGKTMDDCDNAERFLLSVKQWRESTSMRLATTSVGGRDDVETESDDIEELTDEETT